ncbi:DUF302 domain-containing protein [Sulfurirhabdus autotrophica]|uniref:Uncharacterized protein (DUF302 family) n=1 Tax=Sulfurirhabdus autotrophica TaxID=1706046 RepID=A0A4R3XYX5_9PROT|nr:DUF302 domain-containing protein [Sulfurirhabdus autotrophica]TCV83034.1 uncharacterized protein (DUF302 family) [Sulfurirhabdus autotrophica]
MKTIIRFLAIAFFSLLLTSPAKADQLLSARSSQDFEEAMSTLQAAIKNNGYQLSKVQRVDVGLQAKGYKTDKYRVVFYGKAEEIADLAAKHPELIPYLPLNIAIFSEENNTILAAGRPELLKEFFPSADLAPYFERWEKDLEKILDEVRETK